MPQLTRCWLRLPAAHASPRGRSDRGRQAAPATKPRSQSTTVMPEGHAPTPSNATSELLQQCGGDQAAQAETRPRPALPAAGGQEPGAPRCVSGVLDRSRRMSPAQASRGDFDRQPVVASQVGYALHEPPMDPPVEPGVQNPPAQLCLLLQAVHPEIHGALEYLARGRQEADPNTQTSSFLSSRTGTAHTTPRMPVLRAIAVGLTQVHVLEGQRAPRA
mmetsp:Transcript_3718/g.11362  ORF Transcript_3718/g.11362 Transcript_3718/m.11362 type:complete len:218 (-) Transcript_3718:1157-1810(-)